MGYIGNNLQAAFSTYKTIDDISGSFNGSTTSFALTVGGVAPVPAPLASNQCLISVGGVVQRPDDTGAEGFRLSGGNIVFSSAPNTGEDFFGVILAGADYVNVGVNFPSGSVSTPSITFDSDLDTGLYNPGANQLGFATAGTNRLTIDASGNINLDSNTLYVDAVNNRVGVGTTSPSNTIDVNGTGRFRLGGTNQLVFTTDGGNPYILSEQNAPLHFGTNNLLRATIDSSGRLLVGTSTSRNAEGQASRLQIEGIDGPGSAISLTRNSNDSGRPTFAFIKTRSASAGGFGLVAADDFLGTISWSGGDGSTVAPAASIRAQVDGTPGAGDMPGRLVFSTTADGASSPTERMRIREDGHIGFFNTPGIYPNTDNAAGCGFSGFRWTSIYAVNGTIQTSDGREKSEVTNASLGAEFIKALRPVSYKWIEGGQRDTGERDDDGNYIYESVPGQRTHWGFIAQEVKEAVDAAGVDFGGWVLTDKDDPDSQQALRYDQFIAPLTKALQEALAEIDVLKAKVAALEAA